MKYQPQDNHILRYENKVKNKLKMHCNREQRDRQTEEKFGLVIFQFILNTILIHLDINFTLKFHILYTRSSRIKIKQTF